MILCSLQDSERIEPLNPLFQKLFDYIKSHDFSKISYGRIDIDGDNLYINWSIVPAKTKEEAVLEFHHKYLDIHIPLEHEVFGWKATRDIKHFSTPFDKEKDYGLSDDKSTTFIDIEPGQFVIVYPEDAHAPNIASRDFPKIVAKVRI